jgi:uncharacterized OB-fold protein
LAATESPITARAFFERVRAGRLTALKCGSCGELAIPPRQLCPACHAKAWQPVDLRGEGTIASFTIIRVAPRAHAGDAPYALAVVKLREGVSILGRLADIPLEKVSVGLPVRFRPLLIGNQPTVGFGPS